MDTIFTAISQKNLPLVQQFLQDPQLDVNAPNNVGSPLALAYRRNAPEIVKMLLEDPRVEVDLPDLIQTGYFGMWAKAHGNELPSLKWLLALRGSQLNWELKDSEGEPPVEYVSEYEGDEDEWRTLVEIVREQGDPEVFEQVQRFRRDPSRVSHELRRELEVPRAEIASLFSILVFLGEELLQLKETTSGQGRFFVIAHRLPKKLQMILCNHVYQSSKETILIVDSEPAFRSLAWSYDAPVPVELTQEVKKELEDLLGTITHCGDFCTTE